MGVSSSLRVPSAISCKLLHIIELVFKLPALSRHAPLGLI
jgi:hypothetical protein